MNKKVFRNALKDSRDSADHVMVVVQCDGSSTNVSSTNESGIKTNKVVTMEILLTLDGHWSDKQITMVR